MQAFPHLASPRSIHAWAWQDVAAPASRTMHERTSHATENKKKPFNNMITLCAQQTWGQR